MPDSADIAADVEPLADAGPVADAELVARTRTGDADAFAELWRRHHRSGIAAARSVSTSLDADDLVQEAYTRIYQAILAGGGPTGSFRAYLFTSIRNTAASWGRGRREAPIDELDAVADPESTPQAAEDALDRGLTHGAFRSLPSRWQEVLWYSEIEGMKPAEISPLLGMKPAAVAQLAFRAREGLREAWIQAHLRSVADGSPCQWTIEHLGAYSRGNLSRRDRTKVEAHLAECTRCAIVAAEAREVSNRLALVLLPLTLGVTGAAGYLASLQGGGAPIVAMAAGAPGAAVGAPAPGGASAGAAGSAAATSGGVLGGAGASVGLGVLGVLVVGAIATAAVVLPSALRPPADAASVTAADDEADAAPHAPLADASSAPSPSPSDLPTLPDAEPPASEPPAPVAPIAPPAPVAPGPQPVAPVPPAAPDPVDPQPTSPPEPEAPALPAGAPVIAASSYVVDDPASARLTVHVTARGTAGATVQLLLGGAVKDTATLAADGTAALTMSTGIDDLGANAPVGVRYVAGDRTGPATTVALRDLLSSSARGALLGPLDSAL